MNPLHVVVAGVLVLLHLTIHLGFGVGAAAPDLFTLALLILARESHMAVAALIGLALGLLEDAQGLLSFGAHGIALSVVGAAGARTRDIFVGESLLFVGTYLFLGKWTRDLVHWIAVGAEGRGPFVQAVVVDGSLAALYVAAVGLVLTLTLGILRNPAAVR